MSHDIVHKVNKAFKEIDSRWIQRDRKLNTLNIFSAMHQSFVRKRGISHVLEEMCDVSATALSKARVKIPDGVFADVNRQLVRTCGPRVLAVDGSKVHVNPAFAKEGFKTRTNACPMLKRPALHPLAMLNAVVDVHTKCCVAHSLTSHFNERKGISDLLAELTKGDILVFDRGYYSAELLRAILHAKMHAVFRLRVNAFQGCRRFFESNRVEMKVPIVGAGLMRLVKYRIDGRWYACLTTLPQDEFDRGKIQKLYGDRWRVEEFFKRLKSSLFLETSHSRTTRGFRQEVEMRILVDTITLQSQTKLN
ncbi:unnamed protein product, partial [Phaeothamnion confervicola]